MYRHNNRKRWINIAFWSLVVAVSVSSDTALWNEEEDVVETCMEGGDASCASGSGENHFQQQPNSNDDDDDDEEEEEEEIEKEDEENRSEDEQDEDNFPVDEEDDFWENEEDGEIQDEDDDFSFKDAKYSKERTPFNDFVVGGINLGDFRKNPVFQLYEDFDISEFIHGGENWDEILSYRNKLERPSLSFYVDKVARKRWLPLMGYNQPKLYALHYAHELAPKEGQADFHSNQLAIMDVLPVNKSYAAKPTHKSLLNGNWLVDFGADNVTRFSTTALELTDEIDEFDAMSCASALARGLEESCDEIESWALKNVKPGLVIEERWASHENVNAPPHEFNMFTIWGRLWAGQWNGVYGQNRYWNAFYHRNGTVAMGSVPDMQGTPVPDWVPWDELVSIAESLGAHKDMFRTDIFVGYPSGVAQTGPIQIAVSECEIFPTTVFDNTDFTDEATRLWLAGYAMGIYELIENTEVPEEFLEMGMLS